jgi:hypothetical protein
MSAPPPGSVITEVYYVVEPFVGAVYHVGGKHERFMKAVDAAADHYEERRKVYREMDLPERPPLPVIIERWRIEFPENSRGGVDDRPIERTPTDSDMLRKSRIRRGLP